MSVGDFNREALEKLFIDRVEKLLFLSKLFDGPGYSLNGTVKPVELLQKSIAAEGLRPVGRRWPFRFRPRLHFAG
jgi:hypothetical protein